MIQNTNVQPRPEWPKFFVNPVNGNRAKFDCEGDVPTGWVDEKKAKTRAVKKRDED